MHTDESSARPAPKIHKKGSTCKMIEVSDDEEPGPSKACSKCNVSMLIHVSAPGCPVMRSQVAALKSTMHNTIRWMWAMEADVHLILGQMRGMELEVAGMLEKLAEMKEGLADV